MKLLHQAGAKCPWFFGLVVLGLLAMTHVLPAAGAAADALPTAAIAFKATTFSKTRLTRTGNTEFLTSVLLRGGTVASETESAWRVRDEAAFGEGRLDCMLDRARFTGDLSLVLRADWEGGADVTIQLYDAAGNPLMPDLFGNVARPDPGPATDTFVVPLTRYPLATRLSVHRLSGAFTLRSAGVFPVSGEVPAAPEIRRTLAVQLGLDAPPPEATDEAKAQALGTLHVTPALERVNGIGAVALAQRGYPAFHRLTDGPLASAELANSGTTQEFFKDALRFLALQAQSRLKKSFFTSSDGTASMLLHGSATLGLMSVPLTTAQKEEFANKNGYPVLEFAVARDALEVLVNAESKLTELSVPQLAAIYADEPPAQGGRLLRDWSELGGKPGEIKVHGGSPGWGTTKAFRELVLRGAACRSDVVVGDVAYRDGVEAAVAGDADAIGYASLRPREKDVRALAIAPGTGEKAFPVDAEAIYAGNYPLQRSFYGYLARAKLDDGTPLERELVNLLLSDVGQAIVARSGSLPLSGAEVVATRARLGLPP